MKLLFLAPLAFVFLATTACNPAVPESEPHDDDARHSETSVEISKEAQAHMGLETVTAEVQQLTEYLQVTGAVQPIDSQVAHVRPIAAGRLTSVSVRVGDRVAAGAVLALFDNLEAGDVIAQHHAARADLEKLKVQLSLARQQTERNRELVEIGAIPRKDYDLSLAEEKSLAASIQAQESLVSGLATKLDRFGLRQDDVAPSTSAAIRAPFGGVVIGADAAPGEVIGPGDELFRIADLSSVWVQAEVYEKDLGRLQLGQTASITVDTYEHETFPGRVSYISDILDPQTRTAKVRCEATNAEGKLKIDMFATVRLPTSFNTRGIAVPVDAVQQLAGRNIVFVRTGETSFEQRPVEVGRAVLGLAEIKAGLKGGESVVTRGAFHLKSTALAADIGEDH